MLRRRVPVVVHRAQEEERAVWASATVKEAGLDWIVELEF